MTIKEQYMDNVEFLGTAIIHFACKDYMLAYKANDAGKMKTIENFFDSDYFIACSMGKIDGDYLIREIKREVDRNKAKKMTRGNTSGLYEPKPRRIRKITSDKQELLTNGMDGWHYRLWKSENVRR